MRTIETGCAVVDIIPWPENKPWVNRYKTASRQEKGVYTLELSCEVYHDSDKAASAYRRLAHKIEENGEKAPNVVFMEMTSGASRSLLCMLSRTQSVFNTACAVGPVYTMTTGEGERMRQCAVRCP